MITQLPHVLKTYATRPAVWVLGGVTLLLIVPLVFIVLSDSGSVGITSAPPMRTVYAFTSSGMEIELNSRYADSEINGLRLHTHTNPHLRDLGGSEKFPDLSRFVNLTYLELFDREVTPAMLEEIAALPKLERFSTNAATLPPEFFSRIGPRLRELTIPCSALDVDFNELHSLTALERLSVNRMGLRPETLEAIREIPHLRTLEVNLSVPVDAMAGEQRTTISPNTLELRPEDLKSLVGHSDLRNIFTHWSRDTGPTSDFLPGIRLYPVAYPMKPAIAVYGAQFFLVASTLLILLQLWGQFIVPAAAIVPHYAAPHRLAAILILTVTGAVAFVCLLLARVAFLPALAFTLLAPAWGLAVLLLTQSRSRSLRLLAFAMVMVQTFAWFLVLPFTQLGFPPAVLGEFAWFLRGRLSLWATTFLICELAILIWAFRALPTLTWKVQEGSPLAPGFSPWDARQKKRQAARTRQPHLARRSLASPWTPARARSNWRMALLWRRGNQFQVQNLIVLGFLFFVFSLGFSQFLSRNLSGGVFIQLGAIFFFLPMGVWFQRVQSLGAESLRSVNRVQFVRQLFLAIAIDYLVVVAVLACFLLAAVWLSSLNQQVLFFSDLFTDLELKTVGALFALLSCFALAVTGLAIRRTWVIILCVAAVLLLPNALLIALLVGFRQMPGFDLPMSRLIEILTFVVPLALLIPISYIILMYRLALRREWG